MYWIVLPNQQQSKGYQWNNTMSSTSVSPPGRATMMSASAWNQLVPILVWYKALWLKPGSVHVGKEDGGAQEKGCNCSVKHMVRASLLAQTIKNLPTVQETWVQSLGQEAAPEKGMATQSSTLAWRIPWTEEPGGLLSMRLQRVGHDWGSNTSTSMCSWALLPSRALLCCFFPFKATLLRSDWQPKKFLHVMYATCWVWRYKYTYEIITTIKTFDLPIPSKIFLLPPLFFKRLTFFPPRYEHNIRSTLLQIGMQFSIVHSRPLVQFIFRINSACMLKLCSLRLAPSTSPSPFLDALRYTPRVWLSRSALVDQLPGKEMKEGSMIIFVT